MGDASLKRIDPGERATICIPSDAKDTMVIMPNDTMLKVRVHFFYWRGRIAVRFSDPVDLGDLAN